ncbi:hypothetical protein GZL_03693 [Streptomyces sp. 769]|nr:hypothetical protein GZL_03693 [Streptomyces sp. 769]
MSIISWHSSESGAPASQDSRLSPAALELPKLLEPPM